MDFLFERKKGVDFLFERKKKKGGLSYSVNNHYHQNHQKRYHHTDNERDKSSSSSRTNSSSRRRRRRKYLLTIPKSGRCNILDFVQSALYVNFKILSTQHKNNVQHISAM